MLCWANNAYVIATLGRGAIYRISGSLAQAGGEFAVPQDSALQESVLRDRLARSPLPRVDYVRLQAACAVLTGPARTLAMRHRLVPIARQNANIFYAACGPGAMAYARKAGLVVIARGARNDLLEIMQNLYGNEMLAEAAHGLAQRAPHLSARQRLTGRQGAFVAATVALSSAAAWSQPPVFAGVVTVLFSAVFLCVAGLRAFSLMSPARPPAARPAALNSGDLPVYSVLVPLFRETAVIGQLLAGLKALDYPPRCLDIKLILEETDQATRAHVQGLDLPGHMEVIAVPSGAPQTKPKALNYALQFARGDLVVVFDAEDIPDPGQLRLAAETFAASARSVVCLQARLAYYNPNENWLTRQFAIEYAALFDVLLPALASAGLPLPLGGTSNHFRMHALRALGGWDPYNVTEDADLGLRLARRGLKTGVIAATTHEEANCVFSNWLMQRARWLKGWMQTFLVHMRSPVKLWRALGPGGFVTAQILMAGTIASFLFYPVFLVATLWALAGLAVSPDPLDVSGALAHGLALAVFITGFGFTMLSGYVAIRRRGLDGLGWSIWAMPVYWLAISLGGWLALWQFIANPFHWNKTEHGLSAKNRQ